MLPVEDRAQADYATRRAQGLAEQLGFDTGDIDRVTHSVNELVDTILTCPRGGELHVQILPGDETGIEIVALYLPQVSDLVTLMSDDFGTHIECGSLNTVWHHADVFDAHSDQRGTVILSRFYPRSALRKDVRFGISQHSLRDDPACGDVWEIAVQGKRVSMLMIDGLGHGPEAEFAGRAGIRAFNRDSFAEPLSLLEEIHNEMQGTRGGVVAIAQFDAAQDRLSFLGIGDIGAVVVGQEKPRGLVSYPGIVGNRYRKGVVAHVDQCAGQLLILFSDGLKSRWSLDDYPGLLRRHPAVIAAVLNRDFSRGTDDVTVMVMTLEEVQ